MENAANLSDNGTRGPHAPENVMEQHLHTTPKDEFREIILNSRLSEEEKQAILELDEAAVRLPLTIENFRLRLAATEPHSTTPDEN